MSIYHCVDVNDNDNDPPQLAMALSWLRLPPPSPVIHCHFSDTHHSSTPLVFGNGLPKSSRQFSLTSATSNSQPSNHTTSRSAPSTLLPFIEEDEHFEQKITQNHQREDQIEELVSIEHPTLGFVESFTDSQTDSQTSRSDHVTEGVVGEILRIVRNLPTNSKLGDDLREFEGRVGEKECLEVLEMMARDGLAVSCLNFFEWMGLQKPSLVMPPACSILFLVLGRAGLGEELMVLFKNLLMEKNFRDVHVYNSALSGLLSCERYNDAQEVYEIMETSNVQPDCTTCSTMITIMRKSRANAKDTWNFFEKMDRKGVEWSSNMLTAVIESFCEEGLKNEALILQFEMEKKGISSNTIIYNTLIKAYAESNQIEEAEGLFAEMKKKQILPDTITCNILMSAYSRRMQPEIVEKLLQEMEKRGLKPDENSYASLISAYGRQKRKSEMAENSFYKMKEIGIKPSTNSYTALIQAYSISNCHEKAYTSFENMLSEGIKPSLDTYTALLDSFRRAGDTEMLMKIWKIMIHEKIEPNRAIFNVLLDGFAKKGYFIESRNLVSEFGKIGLKPTVMTYNMLMKAYSRGGQVSKLPQLLKEMAVLQLKPNSITYSTMIYAYARVGDSKRAYFYHKEMVKNRQMPDARSYEKLKAILGVKQKKKGKKDEFWKNKKKNRVYGSAQSGN